METICLLLLLLLFIDLIDMYPNILFYFYKHYINVNNKYSYIIM